MPSIRRTTAMAAAVALLICAPNTIVSNDSDASAAVAPTTATAKATLKVGAVTLSKCGSSLPGWCGSVSVPLNWQAQAGGPDITAGFEWLPATGTATGTIVTVEGGPGYSSTGSEGQFAPMVGSLNTHNNVLLFDLRGTGLSTPINCSALQKYTGVASGSSFATLVGNCGTQLNKTWKNSAGAYVQASDQFTTANAARDLHYALGQLALSKVDLYGDSYGSWFAQAFASRYPTDLRSVTLDATYPVLDLDPWANDTLTAAQQAFNTVCRRSPSCTQQAPGVPWDRITALATKLRQAPLTGNTSNLDQQTVSETVDVRTLVDIINNAGFDPVVYSQLDAAARAYLNNGDGAPLLRLAAWSVEYDDTNSAKATGYSDGLYFATICTDYKQLFDMSASPAARAQQFQASVAAEPASTFAPFTPAEWVQMNAYTGAYDACLNWPAPVTNDPPVTKTAPLVPATLPVLVLSGDLDSDTPPDGNTAAVQQLGSSARYIQVPNLTHVTAMPDVAWPGPEFCGQSLYRQFVTNPGALASLDTSCTQQTWPVAMVPTFPKTLAAVVPAVAASGNSADADGLRAATVGSSVVADAIARYGYVNGTSDLGLRGGTWKNTGNTTLKFTFTADQWVTDAKVAGTATWNQTTGAVTSKLTVTYDGSDQATVNASWNTEQTLVPVQLTGTANGATLAATTPVT
jgi:pimeloyl-ACP methyl ester carboxylesterase